MRVRETVNKQNKIFVGPKGGGISPTSSVRVTCEYLSDFWECTLVHKSQRCQGPNHCCSLWVYKGRKRKWTSLTARYQKPKVFLKGLKILTVIGKTSVFNEEVSPLWAWWQCLVLEAESLWRKSHQLLRLSKVDKQHGDWHKAALMIFMVAPWQVMYIYQFCIRTTSDLNMTVLLFWMPYANLKREGKHSKALGSLHCSGVLSSPYPSCSISFQFLVIHSRSRHCSLQA